MTADEGDMLRLWVEHYAGQVGMDNLFVFDDGTTDGSTDDLPCTVHRLPQLPGRAGFERARMGLASGMARGLLAVYDYVVFVDVDEFLVCDPARYADLPDLIARHGRPEVLGAVGLNVVHLPQVEGPLDLTRPILEQRSFAKFTPLMCKPAVKRIGADWTDSSHALRAPYAVDPELFMLHLKFADRDRLAGIAAHRHEMTRRDGRAGKSSWGRPADDLVRALDEAVAGVDPAAVPEFDPAAAGVAEVVRELDGVHRGPREGQLQALERRPLVRIPAALKGAL
jgi:hypothetical protein